MREATRESERARIEKSFDVFGLSEEQRGWVLEALDSDLWDWFEESDGCTVVSEVHWPSRWFPPCVVHDWDCLRGHGGVEASRKFYALQRAYGMDFFRSWLRASAVTVYWYGWRRWF